MKLGEMETEIDFRNNWHSVLVNTVKEAKLKSKETQHLELGVTDLNGRSLGLYWDGDEPKLRETPEEERFPLTVKELTLEERLTDFYDLYVKVDSFSSLLADEGWEVHSKPDAIDLKSDGDDNEPVDSAVRFSVIGDFKKGKTWILSKLCDVEGKGSAASQTVNTPGLCWKRFEINKSPVILMDSKGENSPLTKIDKASMNDKRAEEYALRDILCRMADAFIFMAGSLGSHEQSTIQELCRELANTAPHSHVIVVHNLKHIKEQIKFDEAVEGIHDVLDAQFFQKSEREVIHKGEKETIYVFDKLISEQKRRNHEVPQVHFVLGCQGEESGRKNDFVIANIRQRLLTVDAPRHPETIMEELKRHLKDIVPKYLTSIATPSQVEVKVIPGETVYRIKVEGQGGVPLQVKNGFISPYVPKETDSSAQCQRGVPYRITSCMEDGREKVKLQIKLPGYSEEELREDLGKVKRDAARRVLEMALNGHHVGFRITVRPQNIQSRVYPGEVQQTENAFSTAHLNHVQIEIKKNVESQGIVASYEKGIIELVFVVKERKPITVGKRPKTAN